MCRRDLLTNISDFVSLKFIKNVVLLSSIGHTKGSVTRSKIL